MSDNKHLPSGAGGRPVWRRALMGPVQTARAYSMYKLRRDLVAGLTVSVVELPQAMAYAIIAGVPPQYGIYTSMIQGVIGALLSSSEHMTTGPTNTQSLLVASTVARLVPPGNIDLYLQMVFALTIIKGIIQLMFSMAGMGNMVRYVSRSVIVGVAAGAGVLIIVNQISNLLGLTVSGASQTWPGVVGAVQRIGPHFDGINHIAVCVALACFAIVLLLRAISPFLPGALAAIVLSAIVAAQLGWIEGSVPLVGKLPTGFPSFHVPSIRWSQADILFSGALALALQGMLETVAIAKSIASHTGERINPNQEFFSQGLKNAVSGFFQCIPGSGSFTRSALDYAAGAETRFAAVFNALFVAAMFLLFGNFAKFIPMAALGAVLVIIAFGLIDWRYLSRLLKTSRSDATVCVVTFSATLIAPLEYAIFIGIFLSLGIYLRIAGRLHIAEMIQTSDSGMFIEQPIQGDSGNKQIMFLQIEGDLFFGIADELHERLAQLLHSGSRIIILRLKRTHSVDSTVLYELEQFTRNLKRHGGHFILCGVRPELMSTFKGYGLQKEIGEANIFQSDQGIFTSAKRALQHANELL